MGESVYRPYFSDIAAEFVMTLTKRQRRVLMDCAYEIARHPFMMPDDSAVDENGREVNEVVLSGFVMCYWVDHPVQLVMITEIERVS